MFVECNYNANSEKYAMTCVSVAQTGDLQLVKAQIFPNYESAKATT